MQVKARFVRIEQTFEKRKLKTVESAEQNLLLSSDKQPVKAEFTAEEAGQYRIYLIVEDDRGYKNQTQSQVYVVGAPEKTSENVKQDTVVMIPDKEKYEVGDVAEVVVQPPFTPCEGIWM